MQRAHYQETTNWRTETPDKRIAKLAEHHNVQKDIQIVLILVNWVLHDHCTVTTLYK